MPALGPRPTPIEDAPPATQVATDWLLRELARTLASSPDSPDRYPRAASLLTTATGATEVRIYRLAEAALVPVGGIRRAPLPPVPLAESPLHDATAPFSPVAVVVSPTSPWPHVRALVATPCVTVVELPCVMGGGLVGVIEALHPTAAPWSAALLAQLTVAADLLAVALAGDTERIARQQAETARLYEARAREEERCRLEAQLTHAARLAGVGEVTAAIVHDLAQPLVVLQSYLELVQAEGALTPLGQRAFPVMITAADRLTGMVRHIRDYARNEAPRRDPVDLREVASLARELCAGGDGIRVEAEAGLLVCGDGPRLEQVVVNLVSNALASAGPPVTIRVRRGDGEHAGRHLIEVADHGPGVPCELRALVFEPFFTTRPRGQGTGLGLATSARIVADHGGVIEVDDNPGGGALFRVALPPLPALRH